MTSKKEASIYRTVAGLSFFIFIFMAYKYTNLIESYKKAESDKVYYCKEYHKLKCELESEK